LVVSFVASAAYAEELRVHAGAGAAQAAGGVQQRELATGGGGHAAIEWSFAKAAGAQAGVAAVALPKGEPPAAPGIAPRSTGTAVLGTLGARVHPFGGSRSSLGLGTRDEKRAPDPSSSEPSPLLPARPALAQPIAQADEDGDVEVVHECPEGNADDGCKSAELELLADRIQLGDTIHFEPGIGRVKSKSHWLLFRLAKFINQHPEILEVSVEGHSDATGDVAYNQDLSEARAASTRKFLVKFGVAPERIKVVGHGMAQLRVPTLAAEERNRRVELWVKRGSR
jgi:outer membrane protein OmpA-like peptidoglycan-associated protein